MGYCPFSSQLTNCDSDILLPLCYPLKLFMSRKPLSFPPIVQAVSYAVFSLRAPGPGVYLGVGLRSHISPHQCCRLGMCVGSTALCSLCVHVPRLLCPGSLLISSCAPTTRAKVLSRK